MPLLSAPIIARISAIFSTLIFSVVVGRLLSIEEAGDFFLITTIIFGLGTFGRFGAENNVLKHSSAQQKQKYSIPLKAGLFGFAVSLFTACVSVITFLYFGLNRFDLSPITILLLGLCIPANAIYIMGGSFFRATGHFMAGALSELASVPIISTFFILTFTALSMLNLNTALQSFALSNIATALWVSVLIMVRLKSTSKSMRGFQEHAEKLRIGRMFSTAVSSLLFYLIVWAPILILGFTGNSNDVAQFTIGIRFANFIALIPAIQIAGLGPIFARLISTNSIEYLNLEIQKSVRKAFFAAICFSVLLALSSNQLIHLLFGNKYLDTATLIKILIVGVVIQVCLGQQTQLMLLTNLEHVVALLITASCLIWVVLGPYISINLSAIGIAWLSVAVTAIYGLSASTILFRYRGIRSYLSINRFSN